MHSSEIAAREFPTARQGLDPAAVRAWLTMVAAFVADLEDELTNARNEREQTSASIRRMRRRPASAEIRGALMQAQLRRRVRGYDRHAVQELLRAAASELARLENEVGLLNTELELEFEREQPQPPRAALRRAEKTIMRGKHGGSTHGFQSARP